LLADDGAGLAAFAEQIRARRPRRDAEPPADEQRRAAG
jgi:hypothetical protein